MIYNPPSPQVYTPAQDRDDDAVPKNDLVPEQLSSPNRSGVVDPSCRILNPETSDRQLPKRSFSIMSVESQQSPKSVELFFEKYLTSAFLFTIISLTVIKILSSRV